MQARGFGGPAVPLVRIEVGMMDDDHIPCFFHVAWYSRGQAAAAAGLTCRQVTDEDELSAFSFPCSAGGVRIGRVRRALSSMCPRWGKPSMTRHFFTTSRAAHHSMSVLLFLEVQASVTPQRHGDPVLWDPNS